MYKVEGYNPAAGDWFWAEYGSDGSVRKAGRVQEPQKVIGINERRIVGYEFRSLTEDSFADKLAAFRLIGTVHSVEEYRLV